MIACLLANIHRDPKQSAFSVADFMPQSAKSAEQNEREELEKTAREIAKALK